MASGYLYFHGLFSGSCGLEGESLSWHGHAFLSGCGESLTNLGRRVGFFGGLSWSICVGWKVESS